MDGVTSESKQIATFMVRVNLRSRLPAKFIRSGYSQNRRYGMWLAQARSNQLGALRPESSNLGLFNPERRGR
jgi:hypothetical protein